MSFLSRLSTAGQATVTAVTITERVVRGAAAGALRGAVDGAVTAAHQASAVAAVAAPELRPALAGHAATVTTLGRAPARTRPATTARPAATARPATTARTARRALPPATGEPAAIRAWARNNGHQVAAQGRIPQRVRQAYHDAH